MAPTRSMADIPSNSMHELRWHCVEGEEMVAMYYGVPSKKRGISVDKKD